MSKSDFLRDWRNTRISMHQRKEIADKLDEQRDRIAELEAENAELEQDSAGARRNDPGRQPRGDPAVSGDTEREARVLAQIVIEHFHGPDNRHGSWWLNTGELAEAFNPILAAHDAELTKRVRAEQREQIIIEVMMIPCWANEGRSEFDIPGESHRDTVLAAIREASDE